MQLANDSHLLIMLFILPGLFGFTLIGEGVGKVMNYDPRGWISVTTGSCFLIIIILGYFLLSTQLL